MKKILFFFAAALTMSANAQRTPTMGWSSWNTFALNINEKLILQQKIEAEVPLGMVEIPMSHIAGTRTAGRTKAFANNFMPLLEEGSEFSTKWIALCDSLIEEGLREPVKAYEFLNRFYILEGNKRVSVTKYLGAVTIPAYVTRLLPQKNDSDENRLYYEFVDFYSHSKINYLDFSKPGSYRRLQLLSEDLSLRRRQKAYAEGF